MTTPIQARDYDGGVQVYYALPVEAGATGVFEHVSSWPSQEDAEAEIIRLQAADTRRKELAAEARDAIAAWNLACAGGSDGREHETACNVTDVLEGLLTALRESSLI